MATNEQSVTLLRRNKRAQVAALCAGGFTVDENSRAADFAKYVKWAHGLLDVTLYAVRISDGQPFYFTKEDWAELTNQEKALFVKGGVRVRANHLSFILAPVCPDKMTYQDATAYAASYKAHTTADGIEDTLTWRLPPRDVCKVIYRQMDAINDLYLAVFNSGVQLPHENHWMSEVVNASQSYRIALQVAGDFINTQSNSTATRFRPVVIQNV